jgi:hypothetical protein
LHATLKWVNSAANLLPNDLINRLSPLCEISFTPQKRGSGK